MYLFRVEEAAQQTMKADQATARPVSERMEEHVDNQC
jgi:hypothetical protein